MHQLLPSQHKGSRYSARKKIKRNFKRNLKLPLSNGRKKIKRNFKRNLKLPLSNGRKKIKRNFKRSQLSRVGKRSQEGRLHRIWTLPLTMPGGVDSL